MRIIARHYPNNELRVVICPDVPLGKSREQEAGAAENRPIAAPGSTLVIRSELKTQGQKGGGCASPSGLPPGYGGHPRPTAFGNNARRTILRCGGALEKFGADPSEVAFLTGTLPGSTAAAMRALQDWSSYAVNLLKAKISKLGIHDSLSFYVWELQARGALHIHYAVHVPDRVLMSKLICEFKKMWTQIVDAICEKSGIDLWERKDGGSWKIQKEVIRADAQVCRKSPGAYMAKYVSKDSFAPKYINDKNAEFLGPTRWWGCSRPLIKLMNSMTLKTEKVGISWYRIKYIREELLSVLDGLSAKIKTYTDKAKTSEVFVSYDSENGIPVLCEIARFLKSALRGGEQEGGDSALGDRQERNPVQTGGDAVADSPLEVIDAEVCGVPVNPGRSGGACFAGMPGFSGTASQMDLWGFKSA